MMRAMWSVSRWVPVLSFLVACGARAPRPAPVANQSPDGEALVDAAGGRVAIDHAFLFSQPHEDGFSVRVLLLRGGATPTCDLVLASGEVPRLAPRTIDIVTAS